ncbi:acyltransferase [Helicobacter cappadocius]|uniref:Transferase n=1 Tax=Helicobacter cappadocius TaxID=3063998 RepID=A0AA90PQ77_9HELI|nr:MULTISPECIES: transferase [unclassified Helicobacter]MDO7253943.1 transferase [Helicobacter sp. faydin-H75]MDP2538691.1 transferase [Helicobacter sp. faydin-H76]
MDSFYTTQELQKLGFKSLGEDILLSKKASIYGAQNISIGNNVRIDDFVILSGHINIKSHIHIGAGSILMAKEEGIYLDDFSAMSVQCKILGSSDDFSGNALVGPCIPAEYRKITTKPIRLEKFSLLGCGSTILPGGSLAEGVSVGASSLIMRPTEAWGVYFGIPAKRISKRNKNILDLHEQFLASSNKIYNSMGGGDKQTLDSCFDLHSYSPNLFSIYSSKVA